MWSLTDNIMFNVIFTVGVVLYCFYKYIMYHRNYWDDKHIPTKYSFTNILKVLAGKRSPGKLYQDTYREFPNEQFVGCFKTRQPELLIRDPEMIKYVLVKDFQNFAERNSEITDDVEALNANLFVVHGARWKAMRQKFTPAFTSGKLKYMFPLVVEKVEEFSNFLSREVKKNDEQEVRDLMARLTTDIIGSVAFGVKMGSIEDVNSPFRIMGKKAFDSSPQKLFKVIVRLLFPSLFNLLRIRLLEKEAEDFFINTVSEIVQQRLSHNIKRNDFIDLMLELKEKGFIKVEGKNGEEQIEFSDVFMAAQAFIFFAAGFETSSAVMSFTLFEMAKNPEIQEKLRAEVDRVLAKHDGKLSYDCIAEMEYLECCVNETMRKYPALGNLTRICTSKYTFPGTKLTIDEGVFVAIPTLAIHYDPQYYPEPHKYIPERFSPEEKQNRHPMVFLPFGEGPRNCIGLRFGRMQSMVGIASIISMFTIHESPKTEEKITMNPRSFVTACKHGVWLKLKPRKVAKD